jgi:hypothetical protein
MNMYREALQRADELKRELRIAEHEVDRLKKLDPVAAADDGYRTGLAIATTAELLKMADVDAKWLAQKCIDMGSGAASDSGEARIVVLLGELSKRVLARQA